MISLTKPLCVFDLETTGINVVHDRIVEICIIKVNIDNTEITKVWRINPTIPIPEVTTAIHGITDEMVKDSPTFKEQAKEISTFIKNCDLAGFNSNKFDIPLLAEEFLRADVEIDMHKVYAVDVQNIFHQKEQRNLSAALRFYCDTELVNAHNAEADVRATLNVLKAQLNRYDDLPKNIGELAEYSKRYKAADFAGFITFNEKNEEQFSFGKYKNQTVASVLLKDPGYYSWIQNADFPLYTKKILTAIRLKSK
ncbi:MAG: 3'-5' exonuclease [Schleiferiaceae bacterium]|nr:3'-5' exonuclease [Schleiferiaceae bacterium]MDG1880688.1 3'-5' exonuclease [Schleiferiaceae bacterium]